MGSAADWHAFLDEYRTFGGKAENLMQRKGAFGLGLFPIDPSKPIDLFVPDPLLVPVEDVDFVDGEVVIRDASKFPDGYSDWFRRYQKTYSWGAEGRDNTLALEEGLKNLREELNKLKDIERPKASQAIAEARDKGDLSENAEYDAAKEAQGMLEMQIAKLENTLANARIINESELDNSKVLVLSNVEVKNKANSALMKYKLVAQSEADLKTGKISVESPIGKGLLGKVVGDVADINVPNGSIQLEIISISRD